MRLILVRHGETLANAEGRIQGQLRGMFPLSPEGRAQAEKLREKLLAEDLQPTRVYASPLERAAETAEILASEWPLSVEHWDDLMEHGLGVASGLTINEVAERFPEIDRERPDFWRIEGAEPLEGRRARAERVVAALLARHSDDDVVVAVAHGACKIFWRCCWGLAAPGACISAILLSSTLPSIWECGTRVASRC